MILFFLIIILAVFYALQLAYTLSIMDNMLIVNRKFAIYFMEVIILNLFERVQQLAGVRDMSIAELERKANLGNGTIRRWAESIPSADKLYRVSKVLCVSIEYLISGEESAENEKSKMIARKASNLTNEQLDAVMKMIDVFENN